MMAAGSAARRWAQPIALTVAGSDSSGGAGIQADLKTFQALGVYGASAITAVTAQNTLGVRAVHEVPASIVAAQIAAVVEDLGVDGLKTGVLPSAETVRAVAECVRRFGLQQRLVVDPVMLASSGDRLQRLDALDSLRSELLPLAAVVTPNLPEAEVLVGRELRSQDDLRQAARDIVALGARSVVLKGGHLPGASAVGSEGSGVDVVLRSLSPTSDDLFFDGNEFHTFPAERIDSVGTHGTGCTFSAALVAALASGKTLLEAIGLAKTYITIAIQRAVPMGAGPAPVAHDWPASGGSRAALPSAPVQSQ